MSQPIRSWLKITAVELQDFAFRHLVAQVAFAETQGAVLDRRGSLAQYLTKELDVGKVKLDETAAEVASEDERDQFRLGILQARASLLSFDQFEDAAERARSFLSTAMDYLDGPPVGYVRVHTSDIAPTESFEVLRDALFSNLLVSPAGLRDAIGLPLEDNAWAFEFGDDHASAHVQIGPMRSDQLRKYLGDPDESDYSPFSLFLDINTTLNAESPDTNVLELFATALERNRNMVDKTGRWLKEVNA